MSENMHSDSRGTGPEQTAFRAVRIAAPARLHLGFLDPSASLGRRFGSLGLVVDSLETRLEMRVAAVDDIGFSPDNSAARNELPRVRAILESLRRATGIRMPVAIRIERALPGHAGLGSGTQLAMAVGRAFTLVCGSKLSPFEIARATGRGARSGIGIAGFDLGGLLLDGGVGVRSDGAPDPAPVLSRIAMPAAWRIVLAFDETHRGLSGQDERAALAALPPMPRAVAADICHQTLMRVLPGAAEGDFDGFAAGVSAIQRSVGDHFAPAQAAGRFTSAAVASAIEAIASSGPAATGQSSWGPTGFAILPSAEAADDAVEVARRAGTNGHFTRLQVVAPRNHGARIDCAD